MLFSPIVTWHHRTQAIGSSLCAAEHGLMLLDGVTHLDVIAVGWWCGNHAAPQYGFHGIINDHGTTTMIIKQGKQPINHFTKTYFTSDLELNVKIYLTQ